MQTPPDTDSSSPSSAEPPHKRARYRRTEHSSSETSEAGQFLISNVKYRVAAPPARPLPVDNGWNEDCRVIQQALGNSLENGVNDILSLNGIEPVEYAELVFRNVHGAKSEGQPTILVVAGWDETSQQVWESVVRQAKQLIDARALAVGLEKMDIGIEMIAEELTWSKYVSPILDTECLPSLERDWAAIKDNVARILEAYPQTRGTLTSIALFRLGFSRNLAANPPTVCASVDYASEEAKWPPVLRDIQQYLDTYQCGLHAHIEHNSSETYPRFEPLLTTMSKEDVVRKQAHGYSVSRTYKTAVDLGDDIGPALYINRADGKKTMPGLGTLGCWVEIRTKKDQQWMKYALTNYHVIRPTLDGFQAIVDRHGDTAVGAPAKDSDLWKADINGIVPKPELRPAMAEIEQPTRSKHCFAVECCQQQIAENPPSPERTKIEEKLNYMTAFFENDNHKFGTVYAASGYSRRSPSRGRMDWALIKPTDPRRIGKNTLPSNEEWGTGLDLPLLAVSGKSLKQPPINGLRSTQNGGSIYKKGTTTGCTVGKFFKMKPDVKLREDAHLKGVMGTASYLSEEFLYIGNPPTPWLADHGDSGSLVFDKEGRAVGLLFRGHRVQQAENSYAYISPIEDVFEDIKLFSKGAITDIRIAED